MRIDPRKIGNDYNPRLIDGTVDDAWTGTRVPRFRVEGPWESSVEKACSWTLRAAPSCKLESCSWELRKSVQLLLYMIHTVLIIIRCMLE